MAAHRYWRLVCNSHPTSYPNDYFVVSELKYQTTVGGAPTQFTGGTPIASGSLSGWPASGAFDGVQGTGTNGWASPNTGTTGDWIGYDFGAGVTVDIPEITLYSRPDSYAVQQTPVAGLWQYSDNGTSWTTAFNWAGSDPAANGQVQIFPGPPFNRVTGFAAEAISPGAAVNNVYGVAVEALNRGAANVQVYGMAVEAISPGAANVQTYNMAIEVLRSVVGVTQTGRRKPTVC